MNNEYQSSEELQRHAVGAFADKAAEKQQEMQKKQKSEKDKLKKFLDKYILEHSSTKSVRKIAKLEKRTAQYQLDLSADIVEILEKIKNELR